MKDLSYDELLQAPSIVQFLYLQSMAKEPVGGSVIEEAMRDYPEYFPDELEHKRKWDLIPQQVHNSYWEERKQLNAECYKDMPPSKGIMGWIGDPAGLDEWKAAYEICRAKEKTLAEALHNKYYSQYGIEFTGW